jgi:dynein heavy chain
LNIFYQDAKAYSGWTTIAPQRTDAFFRLINLILADQIREMLATTINVYTDLFKVPNDKIAPTFLLKLGILDNNLVFDPPLSDLGSQLESIFEFILNAAEKVQKCEYLLFQRKSNSTSPESANQFIHVGFTETHQKIIDTSRLKLKQNLASIISTTNGYIKEFDKYKSVITNTAENDLKELLAGNVSIDRQFEEIKKYRREGNRASFIYQNVVTFPLVTIHEEELVKNIADRCQSLVTLVMEKVSKDNHDANLKMCKQFEQIAEKALKKPENIDEMVLLQKFLEQVKNTDMRDLDDQVEDARKRLNLMIDHSDLKPEDFEINSVLFAWPQKIGPIFEQSEAILSESKKENMEDLKSRREKITTELEGYSKQIEEFKGYGDQNEVQRYFKSAQKLMSKLENLQERVNTFNKEEAVFNWDPTSFPLMEQSINDLKPYLQLYQVTIDFQKQLNNWMTGPFLKLEADAIDAEVVTMYKSLYVLGQTFQDRPMPLGITKTSNAQIEAFKVHLPLIQTLCNLGLRDRHWAEMSKILGYHFRPDDSTTLGSVLEQNLNPFMEQFEKISARASKEFSFEKVLGKMYVDWKDIEFTLLDYRESGTKILSAIDDIQMLLDDHIVKTQTMRSSPFIKALEEETKTWERKLILIQEILDEWLKVQSSWLYLEPIFGSEDIMRQMPAEGKKFQSVDSTWRELMKLASADCHVLKVIEIPNMHERFKQSNEDLEMIQKGLNQYLEMKRLFFPRFFFLSNDELLEILAETRDPYRVQPHLKKCFEGVSSLEFQPNLDITGMFSAQKEFVKFDGIVSTVNANGAVERWLSDVEKMMVVSLKKVFLNSWSDYTQTPREQWVTKWPGQVVLAVSQIYWTNEVETAISKRNKTAMKEYEDLSQERLNKLVDLVRGNIPKLARITLEALIVIEVHARDVISKLAETELKGIEDFQWISQLRYYINQETGCTVKMINSVLPYGYEYLGNSGRLVITPLTDRCYRTLFGALQLNLGGAPEGPAGTGKTETVKDLAKALGMFCVVYNCSDGLDYIAMGKFFKGLAASGSWICFDEFNRIDLEVLSVVAQQILTIQRAKLANLKTFVFEGTELPINQACNCFITMNPGYAGRSELPDNLKSLFRPVAMMVPDYTLIAEISLYSFGFKLAKNLAVKITATYRLCSEQLSSQDHYDYGMRAVKSVISAAGNLKQKYPDENENILVLRSIIDVNLPKFLAHDIPLFRGIISDLFPGTELPPADHASLIKAINESCDKLNLQPVPVFIEKVLQIYEMMLVRHGFMLVGEPFSGKTCAYKVLQRALSDMNTANPNVEAKVQIGVINPKSITMGQLYGQFDAISHEWSDGVLACIFRSFAQSTTPDRKWIVFDGPVDAVWIENMNTVLDDNKKLCLTSGEIIQLSSTMSMMFEVKDLEAASPATVSRCGMIYMEPSSLGWQPIFKSWLAAQNYAENHKKIIESLFDTCVKPSLSFVRGNCSEILSNSDTNLVKALITLFECLIKQNMEKANGDKVLCIVQYFLFSLVWSIGGVLNEDGRAKFDQYYRREISKKIDNNLIPNDKVILMDGEGSVYDYTVDEAVVGRWKLWSGNFILVD